MAKKKSGITGTLLSLALFVPKMFGFVGELGSLVKQEIDQAKRNIAIMVFLAIICAILFTSTWLGLLGIFFLYLSTKLSAIAALAIVVLFNIFVMIIVGLLMITLKRNIFFPATLQHLTKAKSKF